MNGSGDYELFSNEAVFQEGLDMLEADHFEEALTAFDYVINHQPYNADAFFHRGIALVNLGRNDESVSSFKHAVELIPTDPSYHSHYGYALMAGGQHDAAIERFDYALELQPDNLQFKIYKACALAEKRNFGTARALLEDVLEQNPDDPEALRHHAAILALVGRDEEALSEYSRLLAKSPNSLDLLKRCANIQVRLGQREEASRSLRQVVAIDPSDAPAWEELIQLNATMVDRRTLLALATDAIEAGAATPLILLTRGRILLEQRQPNQALSDLRRARDAQSDSAEIHYWLARACLESGRLRQAAACAARANQIRPADRRFALLLAQICREMGDLAGEYQTLQTLLSGQPVRFEITRLLVRNLTARGKIREALASADAFLHRRPNHPGALMLSAELAEKAGDTGQATWCYRQLLKQQAPEAHVYLAFGEFLLRQGDTEEAAEVFSRGANLFPESLPLQNQRAGALHLLARYSECVECIKSWMARHRPSADLYWLLGKSLYSLQDYGEALKAFHNARALETRCNGTTAPSFWCLVAEAYTLHHLGQTMNGIKLLENHHGQFQRFAREHLEKLAELYEHAGINARAYSMYARCVEEHGPTAALCYRQARVASAMGRKADMLRHLSDAIQMDNSLREAAAVDTAFKRHRFSVSLQRLLDFHELRMHGQAIMAIGGIVIATGMVLYFYLRPWASAAF